MEDSIFTKIIKREIPAEIIYEDEMAIAFLDIQPNAPGHTLVVPKKQFENILDGDSDYLAHMMKIAQKIGKMQIKVLGADGVNLAMNNGAEAGQDVFHAHLHVIPRKAGDNLFPKPKHMKYKEGEMEKTGKLLRTKLL